MFQTLVPNQQIYILHKIGTPRLETGIVQNVTPPKMEQGQFGQMPNYTVNVTVLVNGQTYPYTLPANGVIGTLRENGGMVVSMSREAMSNEVKNLRQQSVDVLNSAEYHQNVINACDEIWASLNPEVKEKELQKNEINQLKEQMAAMASNMAQLVEMNKQLMAQNAEKQAKKDKPQT